MKTKSWSLAWWIRWNFLVVALATAAALAWGLHLGKRGNNQSAPASERHNDISQMTSYTKEGRYDDAVQLGLELLKNDPTDEIVYQQRADGDLIRAQKDYDQREEWVAKAVSYVDKSLSFNSRDRDTAGVHLFQDARSFESAGDLSADKKCVYYERARKLLMDRVPLLEGDQITLAGKTFPLEPLRKENNKVLAGVKDKATKAGCK